MRSLVEKTVSLSKFYLFRKLSLLIGWCHHILQAFFLLGIKLLVVSHIPFVLISWCMITWQHSNVKAWEREGDKERSPLASNSFVKKIIWTWIFLKHRNWRWTWRIHPNTTISVLWIWPFQCYLERTCENVHARELTCKSLPSQDTSRVLLLYRCRCAVGLADSICLFYLWGLKGEAESLAQHENNFLFWIF